MKNDRQQPNRIINLVFIFVSLELLSDHKCSYEGQNGVELRECCIYHGISLDIMPLRNTHDTVGAYLSLTDS